MNALVLTEARPSRQTFLIMDRVHENIAGMKLFLPEDVNGQSQLLGLAAAIVALFITGAVLIPRVESALVCVPVVGLSALASICTSALVRYKARRRSKADSREAVAHSWLYRSTSVSTHRRKMSD